MKNRPAIAVSGLHRGENPQPGAAVIASLRRRFPGLRLVGLRARAWVEAQLAKGRDVLFVIDVQGARSLRRRLPEAVHLFLLPPDWATLEARLKGRGSESPETLRVRLKTARKELREAACYDHQVVNDRVAWAVGRIRRILRLERRKRQKTLKKA